jgi:hypothetical protein
MIFSLWLAFALYRIVYEGAAAWFSTWQKMIIVKLLIPEESCSVFSDATQRILIIP